MNEQIGAFANVSVEQLSPQTGISTETSRHTDFSDEAGDDDDVVPLQAIDRIVDRCTQLAVSEIKKFRVQYLIHWTLLFVFWTVIALIKMNGGVVS